MSRRLLVATCALIYLLVAPVRIQAQTPVAVPTIDSVIPSDGRLTVAWTAPAGVTGITAYDLRHIGSDAPDKAAANWTELEDIWTAGSGDLAYTLDGLDNGSGHDVQMRTVTTTDGAWSGTSTGTPQIPGPAITSVVIGDGALTVIWTAPVVAATTAIGAYDVRYIESSAADKANANWTVLEEFWTSGSLEGVLSGLTNGTGYDVQVRAVAATDGAWSATAVGTPAEHGGTLETATTLPLTTRMGGVIESGTDVDYFTLELTAATGIIVYTRGDLDTVGQLLDADGVLLSENDQGDELHGRHNFLLWGSLQAGTYYVKVTGSDGATGAYVLGTTTVADSTARSDAQDIEVGGFARGIIDLEETDKDWFRITLTGHTILLVHTTGPAHTSGDLWLSGTGRPPNVERFPVGGNRFFVRANLSPGTYYVEVDGYLDATGAYTLHVNRAAEPGSSTEAAEPLVPLFPKAGTISPADDVDYFRIELAQATHVVIGASGSAVAIAGELLDADANPVDTNIFESRYRISAPVGFTLRDRLDAGTYYLKVTRLPGSSGPTSGRYGLRMWEDYVYGEFFDGCTALTASLSDPLSDPLSGCQWHLDNTGQLGGTPGEDINVREVWAAGHLGEGATVALVDNGFDAGHPDLAPNVLAERNYAYGDGSVFNPGNTHGTGAAGLIAARDNGIGVRGVAPRAQIYVYNLIDDYNHANAADAMTRGMETTAISNNSWSVTEGPGYAAAPSGWERAVVRGVTEGYGGKGVLYVRSGGNDAVLGANSNLSGFRNHYTATAACAVTDRGVRSHYSEQGANLWVCAPSGASYLPAAITTTANFGRYRNNYGGTSSTAAIVSGVAALLRGAYADLTWRDVKLILAGSARKNDPSNTGWEEGALQYGSATQRYEFNHEYGFGVVDAGEAMDLAAGWTSLPLFIEETQASGDISLAVPDLPSSGTPTTVTSSITMGAGVQFTEFVSIRLSLTAAWFRDLQIELESPSGEVSVLSPHYLVGSGECTSLFGILPGQCDLDRFVRFGSAKHLGEDPGGVWTLRIADHVDGEAVARVNSWSLTVYGHRASPAAPAIDAVASGGEALAVTWTAPSDTGTSAITAYDLRTILTSADETADANWTVVQDVWTTGSGALSYVVTGLTGNAEYDVQVRGVNDSGDGLWSDTATGTPTTDEAPTIDAVTPGDQSIAIAWTAPTNASLGTVIAYDLRYIRSDASSKADTHWTTVSSIWTSGSLDYTLNPTPSLDNGVSYDVQVRAVVGTDQHAWSGVRTATPRTTPGAPTIDAVTGAGGSLTVGWSEPASDGGDEITSYDLRHIKTGEGETMDANWTVETEVWSSGGPDLEHEVTGLDSGTQYDVQVRAVNGAGAGAWSATTVGTTRPGAPALGSVTGVASGLTAGWSAPATDGDAAVTSYDLRYIKTSDDDTVETNWTVRSAVWTSGDLTATVTGLEVGTQYDVQVRAVNASGWGPWSASRTGTTALSDDATLGALTLTGVRLSPAFSSGVTSYTASVGYTVMQVTIAATTSDGNAASEFLDGSGNTRTDAAGAAGFQVDLSAGENVIRVEVTAQDGMATGTYSVTVTRTEQDLSLTPPASDPVAPFASTAIYTIRFRGRWTTSVTPGSRPGGAHFSRLIGAVHNAGVTFLESGERASPGVESMAEIGGTSTLRGEVNAARNADPPTALSVLEDSTNSIGPTATRTLSNRTLTTEFPRVTLTTMIAPSHDWFVGVSGLLLLDSSGRWLPSHEVDLFPWDAGTEEGDDFSLSPSVATTPRGHITSIRGTGRFTTERIASLTFTLQSISPSFPAAETGTRGVAENTASGQDIGEPVVATDPDSGDSLSYALGGPDAGSFAIVASTGQLRTRAALDHETASSYSIAVTATDTSGLSDTIDVTITVTNVEEAGVVSLWPVQPRVGTVLRASLSDPDGDVRSVFWRWQRSSDQTSWTGVSGSDASYTPTSADEGMYIRARATYADGEGSGKSADAESGQPVGAREDAPGITVVTLVSGLSIPWDLAFAPDGTMLLTERGGALKARLTDSTVQTVTADFSDLFVSGEAGLMAIVVDPGFASNRRFYTCQAHTGGAVEVIAWTMNSDYTAATRVADPLVGGIPGASIHDGCRLRFGPQGFLWIATGDAASGTVPQDLTSLGGKVLRVDASTGAGAPGNPFAPSPRVYTHGHRNPQGLALRPGTNQMWSVEHGPTVDDEINLLTSGGNYGWDPAPGYDQSVPMTDLVKFPDAAEARWSSGDPTLATSGGIFLHGADWEEWNGRLAVATLKTRSLRIFEFTAAGTFVSQVVVPELDGTYGRLRTPMLGPGGALYLTTSNGGGADRILKVVPGRPPAFAAATETREVAENNSTSAVVATVTATDPDGERLTYTLGGVDAGVFAIPNPAAGGLRATVRFDHEARRSYEVVVTATDPYGLSDSVTLTVTITNVDEPADVSFAAASGVSVSDNALAVDENHDGTLATFSASDPEQKAGLTYTWSLGGSDRGDFAITGAGVLSFVNIPDHERPADSGGNNVYDITVSALDSDGKTGSIALTVTVDPVNEPPAISGGAAPSIEEEGRLLVGTYRASDPEDATIAWQPLAGNDSEKFNFTPSSGRLEFKAAPDYEHATDFGPNNVYDVTLSVSAAGHTTTLDVAVTVTNKEEPGMLVLPTTRPQVEADYSATLSDPDDVQSTAWTWERSPNRSGPWTAVTGAADSTTTSVYTPVAGDIGYYLRATGAYTDGHGPNKILVAVSSSAVVAAPAVNSPPAFTEANPTRSIAENARANAPVGERVTASDPDPGNTVGYELDPASDLFTIDGASGQIRVKEAASLDHETAPSHTVTVKASDSSNAFDTVEVTITVTDVNEPPDAVADAPGSFDEDTEITIDVLNNDSDPEDERSELLLTVVTPPLNGRASVNEPASAGDRRTITYEPNADYHGADTFTYRARDTGSPSLSNIATVSVQVDAVNDAPTFASQAATRSVSESAEAGDHVGAPVTATDIDENDTLTYGLSGPDALSFVIDAAGQITVGTGVTFDAVTTFEYAVTVEARDRAGASATIDVTITVTAGPVISGGGGGGGGGGPSGPSPSSVDFEWNVKRDIESLDSSHDSPTGSWSNGSILWLLENGDGADDAVYAYDLETGERVEDREFELDERNRAPRGVWSDGKIKILWVSDSGQNKLFAHDLESGERLAERDIALAERNRAARGIWSDGETMWVLDGGKDSVFVYDLESGELLAECALDAANNDPRGIWSDGVTVWVSDHGAKRLFAYRLPVLSGEPDANEEDEGDKELERVRDEEFPNTILSRASNNSPRGLWSDGDVMYVADASDGKVYSYNMPDAIDARLASLRMSGIEIGEFSARETEYTGVAAEGVAETTVEAAAVQSGAGVVIDPPDADGDEANGHQVALEGLGEITVTVTSADGSRRRSYRVALADPEPEGTPEPWTHCLRGDVAEGFSLIVYEGGSVEELVACAESRSVMALYALHEGVYVSYILGAPEWVNAGFAELFPGGVPPFTPLTVKSNGPPSADPNRGDGALLPGTECLRGEIAVGFSLVVSGGGSVEDLVACAESRDVVTLYALQDGEWISYILGAPEWVNGSFRELFAEGLPSITPLVVRSEGTPQAN